jgi:hypothetical protein
MEQRNEVVWFVSHANVNDYVEVKTVPDGIALIRAFKSFVDRYENKSAPNPPDFFQASKLETVLESGSGSGSDSDSAFLEE